jgi:hypothetical protein
MFIKETQYQDITVSYYSGLKSLCKMHKGFLAQFRYSPDTTTKAALSHFRNYLKTI